MESAFRTGHNHMEISPADFKHNMGIYQKSRDFPEKSEQQELVEDLVQIITVFSGKLQGKRANKAKKLIRELIQEEADGKSHKSNVDTK